MRVLGVALVVSWWVAGCGSSDRVRECSTEAPCATQAGVPGVCTQSPNSPSSFCVYPDVACASGRRWSPLAGDSLSSACFYEADAGVPDAALPDAAPIDADLTDAADQTPPTVVSTVPAAGATAAEPDTIISATLSEPLDGVAGSLVVMAGATTITGQTTISGSMVSFRPAQPLINSTVHSATLTGVKDVYGNTLAAPHTWMFRVRDKAWQPPVRLETTLGSAEDSAVAVAGDGTAVAVWAQSDGTAQQMYASRFVPGSPWTAPVVIDSASNNASAQVPQLVMDGSGNAIAVWRQDGGSPAAASLWANRYVVGTGWGTPTLIETRSGAVNTFKVASLLSGLTMVVWRDTTFPSKLESVRYELGAGWRPEQTVATADPGSNISQNFGLCVTTGSQVFPTFHLLWDMQDSSYYHVRYSTWVTSTGVWGTPRPIETGNTYSNGTVEIAVPSSLIPVAVWQRGNPIDVLGLPITATLGTATVLDASTSYTVGGTVSANPMGGALAVYTMSGKTAARKFNGTTWAAEAILAQDANALDTLPRIVHDPAGNAIAAWARFDNGLNLRAVLSQLPQNGTWSTRRYIGAMDKEVLLGGLGIDNVGRATVIYAQDENGHNDIWVEQYR